MQTMFPQASLRAAPFLHNRPELRRRRCGPAGRRSPYCAAFFMNAFSQGKPRLLGAGAMGGKVPFKNRMAVG